MNNLPSNMKKINLAIVLLDIIGSTAFVQRYGALKAAQVFQYHDTLARSLIYKYNGREIDRSDGFLCSFDRVIDAVNFALHYQKEIPPKTKLQCRIGIHWGSIIEVQQHDRFIAANAKRVELEGIGKNIAARTMSLCGPGQVLLTKQAMLVAKNRTNKHTPRSTRYVCVGLYRFKGVKKPQEIFAVGETIQSLQPPPGSDKVKRLGGPKYIKKKASDRELIDWCLWLYQWIKLYFIFWWLFGIIHTIFSPHARVFIGLDFYEPVLDNFLKDFLKFFNQL